MMPSNAQTKLGDVINAIRFPVAIPEIAKQKSAQTALLPRAHSEV